MRRRPKWRAQMDLFPFLGGLVCALGVLMMVAISLISGHMVNVPELWIAGEMTSRPHLVIWDGTQVVVDDPDGQVEVAWAEASANNGKNDTAFGKLLMSINESPEEEYVLIAVRPSGFANYRRLAEMIDDHDIDLGHWPIDQETHVSLHHEEGEGHETPIASQNTGN